MAAAAAPDTTVGQGQADVTLLTLDVLNPGPAGLGADVRLTALDVGVADASGQLLADPSTVLETLRVRSGAIEHAAVTVGADSTVRLTLAPAVTVPVDTPMQLRIAADFAPEDAPYPNSEVLRIVRSGMEKLDA